MSSLVLYYSYSGNTRKIGEIIQKLTGTAIVEIETVQPYPADYSACVAQAEQEVKQGFEPAGRPITVNLDNYDTVYLGTPVWWYTFAPPLRTMLNSNKWAGKSVYPFATHGGGIGNTFADFQTFCRGADVKNGLEVYFRGTTPQKAETDIKSWLEA